MIQSPTSTPSADGHDDRLDRARGAFLGLAVGDALGITLEFSRRDTRPLHTEMIGKGPFDLRPGEWTDDTAMALALADSLLRHGGFDPGDVMQRFLAWWREGHYSCTGECFDIGRVTARSLARFEQIGEPFAGSSSPGDAGNGSLMRLAPVALFFLFDDLAAASVARDQSRLTHGAPRAIEACGYFVQILQDAILGHGDPLSPRSWARDSAIEAIAMGSYRTKTRSQIASSGYVADTLEAALWSVSQTTSFEEALILAVNLAGDADTVGAVTGQLAGAIYGVGKIPTRWLDRLAWQKQLQNTATALLGR